MRTHFQQKEALMERTQYPELSAHQELHRKLVADVERFQCELDGVLRPNTVLVLSFLKGWLIQHIQKVDKAYTQHLNPTEFLNLPRIFRWTGMVWDKEVCGARRRCPLT